MIEAKFFNMNCEIEAQHSKLKISEDTVKQISELQEHQIPFNLSHLQNDGTGKMDKNEKSEIQTNSSNNSIFTPIVELKTADDKNTNLIEYEHPNRENPINVAKEMVIVLDTGLTGGEKPIFQCSVCGQQRGNRHVIITHIRQVHLNDKPFEVLFKNTGSVLSKAKK